MNYHYLAEDLKQRTLIPFNTTSSHGEAKSDYSCSTRKRIFRAACATL